MKGAVNGWKGLQIGGLSKIFHSVYGLEQNFDGFADPLDIGELNFGQELPENYGFNTQL